MREPKSIPLSGRLQGYVFIRGRRHVSIVGGHPYTEGTFWTTGWMKDEREVVRRALNHQAATF
jgi:hypothetical protein